MNDHALKKYVPTENSDHTCNLCIARNLCRGGCIAPETCAAPEITYGCTACEFYMCNKCYASAAQTQAPTVRDLRSILQATMAETFGSGPFKLVLGDRILVDTDQLEGRSAEPMVITAVFGDTIQMKHSKHWSDDMAKSNPMGWGYSAGWSLVVEPGDDPLGSWTRRGVLGDCSQSWERPCLSPLDNVVKSGGVVMLEALLRIEPGLKSSLPREDFDRLTRLLESVGCGMAEYIMYDFTQVGRGGPLTDRSWGLEGQAGGHRILLNCSSTQYR